MKRSLKTALVIIAIPVLYALILRVVFGLDIVKDFASVMSVSFVTLVPFVIGFLTVILSAARKPDISIGYALSAPLIPIFLLFFLTLIFGIEGWACWIMILPVFILFGALGGLAARYFLIFRKKKPDRFRITVVLLLPVFASPVEKLAGPLLTRYQADTSIDIRSPAGRIWENVVRVRTITEQEDHGKLTNFLGFPRPIRAELDSAGVGGTRQAIFSKGLVFREVVLEYADRKKMHFSITANPHDIPSTTMDRHVVIGGDFFNVLDGTYELQQLNDSVFRLHLYSHFTLNTHFNFYASWWAGWIMKDIQNNILRVISTRCQGKL